MVEEEGVELVRRQPLDKEGQCTKCLKKCDNESMRCFGCDELYHVLNCPPGATKGQVTATFFKSWENMVTNYPNIQYICDACKQDKQLKKDIIVSNRLCVMEDELKGIKDTMQDRFKGLEDMMKVLAEKNTIPVPQVPTVPATFADKVKSNRSVIVIKKTKNGAPADMDIIYKAAVDTNAAVSNAYKNNTGDTVVVCENDESKNSLLPELNQKIDTDRFKVVTPASRLPSVTIIDIGSNYSKVDLLSRIKSQNASKFGGIDLDENNFKIIYQKPHARNKDLYKAVVRVSEEVRKAIANANNKLNIGLRSCPVFDDFFVRRCNKCQRYNHWKDKCPEDSKVVCGKCGGEHEITVCTSEVTKCYNCVQANRPDTNHVTSFYKCPVYMEAQKKLESTINYYKNNPKN